MKDNFSTASNLYAQYRPGYPDAFYEYLNTIKTGSENAWDCGTGNGQVAVRISSMFKQVYATDISQAQINNAPKLPNIHYTIQPAERTDFKDHFFDLIIVAQAIHWFEFDLFYAEVKRTAKNNALFVVLGYGQLKISTELDPVINELYAGILGTYWDKERKYVDEGYQTIPFPFEVLPAPYFENTYVWTFAHLIGYLNTWSAVKHYIQQNGTNPIDLVFKQLQKSWGNAEKRVINFPLLLRIGKVS
jgi:hypothetical protein